MIVTRRREPIRTQDRDAHPRSPQDLSVRELLEELAVSEDVLRQLPALVVEHGRAVPHPARRGVLARQGTLVRELRARRLAWRRHRATATAPSSVS